MRYLPRLPSVPLDMRESDYRGPLDMPLKEGDRPHKMNERMLDRR